MIKEIESEINRYGSFKAYSKAKKLSLYKFKKAMKITGIVLLSIAIIPAFILILDVSGHGGLYHALFTEAIFLQVFWSTSAALLLGGGSLTYGLLH